MAVNNAPLRSDGALDYEGLMKVMKYLLDASWGPKWGSFSPDGPNVTDPSNVDYPIIIHYVKELRPGLIGNNTREIKPRFRYKEVNGETNGQMSMNIYGQVMEAEIVFEIWEGTNGAADKLVKQFRQTISAFTGYLKQKGIKEIQFMKMEPDLSNGRIRDNYKVRKLSYFVRFEELTEVPTDIFRVIDVVETRLQAETEAHSATEINGE